MTRELNEMKEKGGQIPKNHFALMAHIHSKTAQDRQTRPAPR